MKRHRRRASLAAAFALSAIFAGTALASFSSSSSATMSVGTGTLASPATLAVGRGSCSILAQDSVVLTWAATSSTFAEGYEVMRGTAPGGPYSPIATVSGNTTVTYTDAAVAFATTYYYVVRAKRNAWRSASSTQVSITTRTSGCVI